MSTFKDTLKIRKYWLIYDELSRSKKEVLDSQTTTFLNKVTYIKEIAEARLHFWEAVFKEYPDLRGKHLNYTHNVGINIIDHFKQ